MVHAYNTNEGWVNVGIVFSNVEISEKLSHYTVNRVINTSELLLQITKQFMDAALDDFSSIEKFIPSREEAFTNQVPRRIKNTYIPKTLNNEIRIMAIEHDLLKNQLHLASVYWYIDRMSKDKGVI